MKNLIFTLMMICFVYGALGAKRIAFLQAPGMSEPQVGLQQALKDKGYTVDISYTPFDFVALAGYDLVIISRTVQSSVFSDAVTWNSLNVPVVVLSSWCIRDSRMKLILGSVVPTIDGTVVDPNLVTNALPIANGDGTYDGVFNGVTTAGAAFPYVKWFYDFIDYYSSDFVADHNTGKVLAVLPDDAATGAGSVVMARWNPGLEAYPGSGIHANYRTYMNIGADDDNGAKFNFDSYTGASLKLFLNEVAFLMDPTTGVRDLKNESQVKVYPNPSTNGRLTIEMKDSKSKTANIQIYTATGMQVYNKYFEPNGSISINSCLTKGLYLLVVNTDGNKSSQKIVIN